MNSSKVISEPKLDKPGAGLPFWELAIAKHIMFPLLTRGTNKQKALDIFSNESKKIVELARGLDSKQMIERRLVPRLQGLEDSSRFWSVAMAMQHLVIVGTGIEKVIVELSNSGSTKLVPRSTADVKPAVDVDPEQVLKTFQQMTERFIRETSSVNIDAFPSATFPHSWFGPLNAQKWLTLAGMHEQIHRKQIEKIISNL